ncbi:putative recombination initiation defects 3 [Coffea arabica]|uniref:Protein PAIR1-like n=1 Tax=Coffea arabica TaxID=13443 RepID=A0A6P6W1B4_COFAR|nr:protein PAIR1-like [Coffea arabica]
MKLKINKASDLSSISVLPPHSRRPSAVATGAETSIFGKSQASATVSQFRSQAPISQQSAFSQGVSSQHGLFSQISQNSLEDVITHEQRLSSQERETSAKRNSFLAPINCPREESQMQISRSSANQMRKWSLPEHKCQINEELEHRIGMMETSLSRFGMILDSVQSDIMQVNKGTKELVLEVESIRQKMVVHDDLLQLMNKGQEDIKSSLNGGFKALSGQFSQNVFRESSREISSTVSALPEKIQASMLKFQKDLMKTFTKEIQTIASRVPVANQKCGTPVIPPPKGVNHRATLQEMQSRKSAQLHPKVSQENLVPKTECGGWKSVKHQEAPFKDRNPNKSSHQGGIPSIKQERKCKVVVESDEDTDGGIFCLFKEMQTGNNSTQEANEETERILRKARRQKRKRCNPIVID